MSWLWSWKWAGGGYVSTARDVAAFGEAILHNRLFSEETKELFLAPMMVPKKAKEASMPDPPQIVSTEYGLGWSVKQLDGRRIVSHGGGAVGASSYVR